MKKNMGTLDKGVRITAAIIIALLYFFDIIGGTLAYILMAVSFIFLITSFINFCPLYTLFGWNTCKVKQK